MQGPGVDTTTMRTSGFDRQNATCTTLTACKALTAAMYTLHAETMHTPNMLGP